MLDEFKDDPNTPVTHLKLYDYLIEKDLNVNLFLDHLEDDHPEFQKYINTLLKKKIKTK